MTLWAFLGFLIATTVLMAASALPLAALAMGARGVCFEICRTGTVTLLQTSVPDNLRGRLMSTQFFLQQGASALGVGVIGTAAEGAGLRAPILWFVGLAVLAWGATIFMRERIAASFGDGCTNNS